MAEDGRKNTPDTDVVELQAELLQARASLYDTGTELPTVPVLLDQVRRMLDEHDAVRVYLVRIEQEQSLEAVVGWESYDSLLEMVARYLGEVVLSLGPDRSLLGIDGVRGDRFVLFVAGRRQPQELFEALQAPISVPGATDPRVEEIRLRVGQGTISRDPALRIERCIYGGIDEAARDFERRGEELDLERRHELTRVLRDRTIRVLFQPIVRLPQRTVVGYEALSRGPEGSYVEGAETLFGFAEREGLLGELERLCVEKALGAAHRLPLGSNLFINLSYVGMEYFDDSRGGLGHLVRQSGWSPREFVLEITERTYARDPEKVKRRISDLRRQGFRFAIDDMGTGYSSLNIVADLQPEYIKLDQMLVRDLHHEPIKRNLVQAITGFARTSRALIIAEGVEQAEEASILQELGVHLLQGFYFGRPKAAG